MKKINIIFFSGNRAEYSLIYPFLKIFLRHSIFNVELVVAGSHFSKKFGSSIEEIKSDKIKYTKILYQFSLEQRFKLHQKKT